MKVTVIGTGYVGLVTGTCLAHAGHEVVCVDTDTAKVASLQQGQVPIYEPGLEDLVHRNTTNGRLSFVSDMKAGVAAAEAIFLALPTPPREDGSADLSAVLSVAKQLGSMLPAHYCVIIDKSTVPVGTAEKVQSAVAEQATSEFDVVSNPEFLREGFAVQDFNRPERVVVGTDSPRAEAVMRALYASFVDEQRPLLVMSAATAELAKYAANTFLVTKISFINEVAQICERVGADVDMLRQAIGHDSRIGHKFLYPGIGYGGSCFPKDVRALQKIAADNGYDFKLLEAAMDVNIQQYRSVLAKISDHFDGDLSGKIFALWGLAFKPDTDDVRESPAMAIIKDLLAQGALVRAYDPVAMDNVRRILPDAEGLTLAEDKMAALPGAEALIVATEWAEFIEADLPRVKETMASPTVFDGRNIYQPRTMENLEFDYYSVGRRPVLRTKEHK